MSTGVHINRLPSALREGCGDTGVQASADRHSDRPIMQSSTGPTLQHAVFHEPAAKMLVIPLHLLEAASMQHKT